MKLSEAIRLLTEAGVDSPQHDAREIFAKLGKLPPSELFSADAQADDAFVREAVLRRAARYPLQYLIGEVVFYRETYLVSPACLIPREDTELLVDYAVAHLPAGASFLDLCTGSGCIAVSALLHTENTRAAAVDLSIDALRVAKTNAARYGLSPSRLTFLRADVKAGIPEALAGKRFFAILSNPPYVKDAVCDTLAPELAHEPRMALAGGEDGGDFYRAILASYRSLLEPEGFFAFEIGYDQSELLTRLAAEHGLSCEIFPDLSGNPRLAVLR